MSKLKKRPTLLIVDDEKHTRDGLRAIFENDFDVFVASNPESALQLLTEEKIDLLLTDLRLGSSSGMDLLQKALNLESPPICIMMTAYGSVDTAVEAMKRGAYDFVTKPINLERLELLVKRALRERELRNENLELRRKVENPRGLENMIGQSEVMVRVFETIRQVAPSRATVLIEGESGTGKELAARAIHALSNRADKPFIAVHCAALSPQLLESELFGHEKGAFTGALERRIGRFEQADGGTLFLDEIGEIDSTTQVKILRFLGERTFERVGGNQTLHADIRLIAATNRNLQQMVAEGTFREDLYFRLNVVRIRMPPLRERPGDIPLLAQAFLRESSLENGKPLRQFTPEAMSRLLSYHWPGNVRELRAAVEHGVVMATGSRITLADLPESLQNPTTVSPEPFHPTNSPSSIPTLTPSPPTTPTLNLDQNERSLILQALKQTRGNRSQAAKLLGISRRTLYRRLEELKISPPHSS
ncbi:MAG: sigma-54 dependent transcriptional regulator [Chthoniobacterales bacterium]|nr:sigma-54 dependent transcriptional regulator [Chthoniobacterales bacterium]